MSERQGLTVGALVRYDFIAYAQNREDSGLRYDSNMSQLIVEQIYKKPLNRGDCQRGDLINRLNVNKIIEFVTIDLKQR